jgi:acyl-CoA thioester hydrolase
VTCDYKVSTTFSDRVDITVSIKEFKGVKLHLAYEMKNSDGKIVCLATSSHAFLNREGRPIRMKQEYPDLFEVLTSLAED